MSISLTPELVAKVHRSVADPGPTPGRSYLMDEDYAAFSSRLLLEHDVRVGFWVFAYGSLIWKPAFVAAEERSALVSGWHRAFALRLTRWRGTLECPGLMLALDRGGRCRGLAYRLPRQCLVDTLESLLRREMTSKPPTSVPRWVRAMTPDGVLRALAFTVDRRGPAYAGDLGEQRTVEILSTAVGHWGSCAEYLLNTVEHLERRGIHDRTLWRLQALVAERIAKGGRSEPAPSSMHMAATP